MWHFRRKRVIVWTGEMGGRIANTRQIPHYEKEEFWGLELLAVLVMDRK